MENVQAFLKVIIANSSQIGIIIIPSILFIPTIKEETTIQICPYLEASFKILGRSWNGLIIHYLSLCPEGKAHFSEMKRNLPDITPRALSLKLSELADHGMLEKHVSEGTPVIISYQLTEKGIALSEALKPIQEWAQKYQTIQSEQENDHAK